MGSLGISVDPSLGHMSGFGRKMAAIFPPKGAPEFLRSFSISSKMVPRSFYPQNGKLVMDHGGQPIGTMQGFANLLERAGITKVSAYDSNPDDLAYSVFAAVCRSPYELPSLLGRRGVSVQIADSTLWPVSESVFTQHNFRLALAAPRLMNRWVPGMLKPDLDYFRRMPALQNNADEQYSVLESYVKEYQIPGEDPTSPCDAANVLADVLPQNPEMIKYYLMGFPARSARVGDICATALAKVSEGEDFNAYSDLVAYIAGIGFVSPVWAEETRPYIPAKALYIELQETGLSKLGPLDSSNYLNALKRIDCLPYDKQTQVISAMRDFGRKGLEFAAGLLKECGMDGHRPDVDLSELPLSPDE